jgi:hypothetical protein
VILLQNKTQDKNSIFTKTGLKQAKTLEKVQVTPVTHCHTTTYSGRFGG